MVDLTIGSRGEREREGAKREKERWMKKFSKKVGDFLEKRHQQLCDLEGGGVDERK